MTHLAVSIMVDDPEAAAAQAALAAERGADLIEFRFDHTAANPDAAVALIAGSPLPCIATCRPAWEGGDYEGNEPDRLAFLRRLAEAKPAFLDLEWVAAERGDTGLESADDGPRLILSNHDFDGRPDNLLRRVGAIAGRDETRVVKLAWRARSLRDNLEAFDILAERAKPTVALCMGEFGLPSRVLAKKFGGFLTFAGLDDESVTAPGQPGVHTLKTLYRWDAIGPDTRVYGVIGHPVGHSMSPHIFNAAFDAAGTDAVYLPMPVAPGYEPFKATVGAWLDHAPLGFAGASVTIPHKQHLLRFVAEAGGAIDPLSQRIGAANTLTVGPDGSLSATNTDQAAALDAVAAALETDRDGLAGRRVAVIGAGGAARAIVAGFEHHGAEVTIYNRTVEKAQTLAEAFGAAARPLDDLAHTDASILINCTPIGMHPETDATPVPDWPAALGAGAVVFDTIYNPLTTRLLDDATKAGCKTVGGLEMFVRQAAAQYTLWTGAQAPTDLFTQVVTRRLSA